VNGWQEDPEETVNKSGKKPILTDVITKRTTQKKGKLFWLVLSMITNSIIFCDEKTNFIALVSRRNVYSFLME